LYVYTVLDKDNITALKFDDAGEKKKQDEEEKRPQEMKGFADSKVNEITKVRKKVGMCIAWCSIPGRKEISAVLPICCSGYFHAIFPP